jgi:hypothetical protein
MLMVVGCVVVLAGVIVGWFTVAGSGIHERPYGKGDAPGAGRHHGESPLDSGRDMAQWSRGTQSSRHRHARRSR